ncbi:uncharacterized protein LOC132063580 [Lycium ferocissimum]|uniref:uncharacterized protein LOC132063580 n=1 Tax=Lycium ferocissimum TaxID=112874 RepID=UPI00281503EF|nr:uncharacterized protein LOC132063580 [Lycium ferocissimum]
MGENTTETIQAVATTAGKELISPSHPYFIAPSDSPGILLVKTAFDGKGFAGWRKGVLTALTAKNKDGFIDGTTSEPTDDADLHKPWGRANNMVISWLLNSLSREISESVIYSSTTKDLWSDLEARFSQSCGAKLFQLQKELSDLVQGANDIAAYYTKIKRLWDELDALDIYTICSCNSKDNILKISLLPTVANAYALLVQEEKQREFHNTPMYPDESS